MDPEELKNDFRRLRSLQKRIRDNIAKSGDFINVVKSGKQNAATKLSLEGLAKNRQMLVDVQKECGREMIVLYKSAIINDVDVDGSRLLKVYQFFFRNISQIGMLLTKINLPRGSNSIWRIVILTSMFFLYATV